MGRTARAGREGRAVSLVTPQDVGLVRAIEEHTGAKMTELELDDSRVAEILVQVNTARREADLQLGEQDWGLARETNKRKQSVHPAQNFCVNPDFCAFSKMHRKTHRKSVHF